MHKIDDGTMERYKKALTQDPNSQVFAPLAEGFRERGDLKEAERVAQHGVKRHPLFPGGWVVLGKIYKDQKKSKEAIETFEKVISLDSMNLLAYQCLGDICLEQARPKEALKYYKMVLFLNPQSAKAQKVVQKLESLTADEYSQDVFEMAPLNTVKSKPLSVVPSQEEAKETPSSPSPQEKTSGVPKGLQRMLSLVDAFIVRNDLAKAQYLLSESEVEFGEHPEISQRRKVLYSRQASQLGQEEGEVEKLAPIMSRESAIRKKKLRILHSLLRVIEGARP